MKTKDLIKMNLSERKEFTSKLYEKYECLNRVDFWIEWLDEKTIVLNWHCFVTNLGYVTKGMLRNVKNVAKYLHRVFPDVVIHDAWCRTFDSTKMDFAK